MTTKKIPADEAREALEYLRVELAELVGLAIIGADDHEAKE